MTAPVARTGGRLLMIEPGDRVLLIHEELEFEGSHWLTPGGGTEAGELPADAAIREAAEEVGYDAVLEAGAEPVLVTRRLWSRAAVVYDQVDHFFLVRVPTALQPVPRGLTDVERDALLGYRWWSLAELRSTDEVVLPAELGEILAEVLAEVPAGVLGVAAPGA